MTMNTLSHKCHVLQQSHKQPPTPTTSPVLLHPHWSPLIFLVSGVQEYKAEHQKTYHTRECASIVWVCRYNEPLKLIVLEMPHRYLLRELQMSQAIPSVVYHKLEDPVHIRNLEASVKLALHQQPPSSTLPEVRYENFMLSGDVKQDEIRLTTYARRSENHIYLLFEDLGDSWEIWRSERVHIKHLQMCKIFTKRLHETKTTNGSM